jgi:hypothetical protein
VFRQIDAVFDAELWTELMQTDGFYLPTRLIAVDVYSPMIGVDDEAF